MYIEDFRMGLQQTVTEGFREYRSPAHRGAKWRRCEHGPLEGSMGIQEGEGVVDRDTLSLETQQSTECTGNMDRLVDQELIQLQTYAAQITSTLRRAEYQQGNR